jgi:hypothetical protein
LEKQAGPAVIVSFGCDEAEEEEEEEEQEQQLVAFLTSLEASISCRSFNTN